jgi:hypothetical protein
MAAIKLIANALAVVWPRDQIKRHLEYFFG